MNKDIENQKDIEKHQIDKLPIGDIVESLPEHKCRYCGVMTTQPDEECYKAPESGNVPLPNVLFVGARLYRINYNEITEVITIERVTKTQAIAKGGNYKFGVGLSSYGSARRLGNTDRWSGTSFYLETPKLQEQLWKQNAVKKLKDTDYSKLSNEVLEELIRLVNCK